MKIIVQVYGRRSLEACWITVHLLFLCACIKTALVQLCDDKSQLSTIHDFAFWGLHPLGFPGGHRYARDQCVADILPFFTGRGSSITFSASIESLPTMIHGIFYCILGKKSVSHGVVLFYVIEGLRDTSVPALGHLQDSQKYCYIYLSYRVHCFQGKSYDLYMGSRKRIEPLHIEMKEKDICAHS
jgi:hypothetical protein